MADTERSDYPGIPCSDCGTTKEGEVYLKHWGPLVPPGEVGHFCQKDFFARKAESNAGLPPRELGTKPRVLPPLPLQRGREATPTDPRNVIALVYSDNISYTRVTRPDLSELPDGVVSIDPERGVWVAKPASDPGERNQELAIGQARTFTRGSKWGVIGIYDVSNLDHLNRLLEDSQKATSDQGRLDED